MLCSPVSVHGGVPPCPSITRLSLGRSGSVALARYGHTLRFYIRPHFVKWSAVAALKLRLVPPTAGAPCRVHKTGLMQSGLRWGRACQPSALPRSPVRPPRHRLAPCGGRGTRALVRRCARCCRSVACGQLSCVCPAHPCGPAAARLWALRGLPVRPQGAPCSTALEKGEGSRRLRRRVGAASVTGDRFTCGQWCARYRTRYSWLHGGYMEHN